MRIRSNFALFIFGFAMTAGALLSSGFSAEPSAEESQPSPGPQPTPVTRQEVWQALAADLGKRGLAEQEWPRAEDLEMPYALPAQAKRKVRVLSACWDEGPRRTQFRMDCGAPEECLPFFVYLHRSVQVAACGLAAGPPAAREAAPKPTVRPGDQARAVFRATGLRMTASVTCLEPGREGDVIRVRALDGHIFRARISGPGLLEALPQ